MLYVIIYKKILMQVICLEEPAFFALVETVCARIGAKIGNEPDRWVPPNEAMRLLNLKSKSSLQLLRDTSQIRFTAPRKKVLLYDRLSIEEYLEKHAQNTF